MSRNYVGGEHVTNGMRKRWAERKALLRVARAAKVVLPEIPHGQTLSEYEHKQVIELMEALKEVEHLLG